MSGKMERMRKGGERRIERDDKGESKKTWRKRRKFVCART